MTFRNKSAKQIREELAYAEERLKAYKEECTAESFGIIQDEYKYFVQDLLSKGLMNDDGVGAIGTHTLEIMSITSFGIKFLNFIEHD